MSSPPIPDRLIKALRGDTGASIVLFISAIVLRALPEILVASYPVGFETISYYMPAIYLAKAHPGDLISTLSAHLQFLYANQPILDTFRAGPIFYVFTWILAFFSGLDDYLLLKVVAPVLYGCLAIAFFAFSRRGMGFSLRLSFLATLIFVFQIATLRESWDRYRTVLALAFLLMALASVGDSKNRWVKVGAYGFLATLSRDYVGFLLILTVLGYAIFGRKEATNSIIALAPSILALSMMFNPVYFNWNSLSYSSPFAVPGYEWAVTDVFSIFLACYLPILPFVAKGLWSNRLLNPMFAWLLVGSFSIIVVPSASVPGYQRWLVLLAIPLSIYSARGLQKLGEDRLGTTIVTVIMMIFIILGLGYSTGAFSYTTNLKNSYIPPDLTQSAIPWDQIDSMKAMMIWLKSEAPSDSTLLAEERFYGWSLLFLESSSNNSIGLRAYGLDTSYEPLLSSLAPGRNTGIYLIWYTGSNLEKFQTAYTQGHLTIFRYVG